MKKILIMLILASMLLASACNNRTIVAPPPGAENEDVDNSKNDAIKDNGEDEENKEDEPIMAPDFELKDMEDNLVKLSDFRGKKVMINFWATWCGYCVKEMPDLMKLQEEYGDDLVILYVNVAETKSKIEEFVEEHSLTGTIVRDEDGKISATYGVSAYPTTYAINEKGEVVTGYRGFMEYNMMEIMYNMIK